MNFQARRRKYRGRLAISTESESNNVIENWTENKIILEKTSNEKCSVFITGGMTLSLTLMQNNNSSPKLIPLITQYERDFISTNRRPSNDDERLKDNVAAPWREA